MSSSSSSRPGREPKLAERFLALDDVVAQELSELDYPWNLKDINVTLSQQVMQNYNKFVTGMQMVQSVETELSLIGVLVKNGRRKLQTHDQGITRGSMQITRQHLRRQRLKELLAMLEDLQSIVEIDACLRESIDEGRYAEAIVQHSVLHDALASTQYRRFPGLVELQQRMGDHLALVQQKLSDALRAAAVSADFQAELYEEILKAYSLLTADHAISVGKELLRHISEVIVAVSRQCMLAFSTVPPHESAADWHRRAQLRDLCKSMDPGNLVPCIAQLYEHLCNFLYRHQFLCAWHLCRSEAAEAENAPNQACFRELLKHVHTELINSKRNVWHGLQQQVSLVLLTLDFQYPALTEESFMQILHLTQLLVDEGDAFMAESSKTSSERRQWSQPLRNTLKTKAHDYFNSLHFNSWARLKASHIEQDTWQRLPVARNYRLIRAERLKPALPRTEAKPAAPKERESNPFRNYKPEIPRASEAELEDFFEGSPTMQTDDIDDHALLQHWIEDRNLGESESIGGLLSNSNSSPVVSASSVELAKLLERYCQMMGAIPSLALDIFQNAVQLVNFYVHCVLCLFVQDRHLRLLLEDLDGHVPATDPRLPGRQEAFLVQRLFPELRRSIARTREMVSSAELPDSCASYLGVQAPVSGSVLLQATPFATLASPSALCGLAERCVGVESARCLLQSLQERRDDLVALLPKEVAQEAVDHFFQAEEVVANQLRSFVLMNAAKDLWEVPDVGRISLDHFSSTVQANVEPALQRLPAVIGGYERLQVLGEGSFGTALLVRGRRGAAKYVAKEIRISHLGDKEKQLALSEAETLRRVSHANIIRYVESFMDTRLLYIVMEYADFGDLATQIKLRRETQGRSFSEKEIMHIHLQLALALTHIHRLKILHRDLKPLNIFLTRRWIVKLGDFGISKVLESTTAGAQTTIGTPLYLAPEICSGEAYGTKSDLWSLGVVTYEMAALQVPFQAASMVALIMKVCSAEPAPLSPSFSRSFLDIVFGLLSKDPRLRLRLEQILGMSFTRHHMQSLLDHSRELEGESSPEAPDIIRTQKATHPLAPSPCSPAQDTAEAVRAEFFRNREVARLAKERCRGDALLRAPTAPPEIERRVERPEPRPRAGSSTPDHREAVRRRAEEEKEAKQAARMQELEEARRQAYQDRLEAKQRMEQGRRSQLGAGRGLRSSADMPPPDSPETPLPDSPESQKLDSPEVPRPSFASGPLTLRFLSVTMAIRRPVRGALIVALGLCRGPWLSDRAIGAVYNLQSTAFTKTVEVTEVETSAGVAFVAKHPVLVSFLCMFLCGGVCYMENSVTDPQGPAEKRKDYNSFLMIQNILCFASGMINALCIFDMGMTVSHQSGNTSHTGRLIFNGAAKFGHLLLAFCFGSFFAGFSKADTEAIYQARFSPNMLGSALAVVFGCMVHYCKAHHGDGNDAASESLLLLAFSQGIMNGVTRMCKSVPICTTHFTGYLTDVGTGLGLYTRAQVNNEAPPTLLKVLIFAAGILFFGLGGVAAKELYPSYGMQAALIPAAIMAAVAGGLIPVMKTKAPGWAVRPGPVHALPEEQTILMDAAVLMDATILADEKELERTLLPEPLEPGSGTPVTPVVPASASTSSATSAGSLAASPKTPARSQADERPIRPATAAQLSALLEGTQDSLTYSEPYSQQSSLPSTLRNCLDAAEAKEVRETQSRSEALPQAASVITLHMDAASAPEKRAGPGDTEDKASTGRCCDIM
ncbi:unnamed protein product [Effrenium voratum]|nr:unnamed protein product [Effrenium voratum]